jgi:hypothetical protein
MSCCEPETSKQPQYGCCECPPVCCSPHGFARRFVSGKEKQEWLTQYKEQLEKEIAGVNEHIQELKGSGE